MIKMREFKEGEVIFREAEPGDTAYLIERGRVEIVKGSGKDAVHIAYIEANQPFGEMSMIDEKPRSATAIAVEPTVAQELNREDFLQNLESHPKIAMNLLRLLFERLREADATIQQLSRAIPPEATMQPSRFRREAATPAAQFVVTLSAMTPEARKVLTEDSVRITRFPFRISTCHDVSIIKAGNRIGISDRGNSTGSILDGRRFGCPGSPASTIFLSSPEATLIVGDDNSPYRFKIGIVLAEA
jgi:CRP-like cAMP-binding protein